MPILRHFETEADYRKHKALSSSRLASYYHDGIYSPDHALIKIEYKSYFEEGKMYETLLQDTVKGTHDFDDRFFVSGVSGKIPDEMIGWIDNKEDLTSHIEYKKDGGRKKKTKHAFIDECLDNPDMIPVSVEQWDMLKTLVENMCKMPYPGTGTRIGDLLAKAEWQVGIRWKDERTGLEKKALLDCIVDLGGVYLEIDIKTAADEKRFGYRLSDHYFIQDLHYTEGVEIVIGQLPHEMQQMLFLVAYKTEPYLCQPRILDYGDVDYKTMALQEYWELCESFAKWDGQPRGWLPISSKKLYLPNQRS